LLSQEWVRKTARMLTTQNGHSFSISRICCGKKITVLHVWTEHGCRNECKVPLCFFFCSCRFQIFPTYGFGIGVASARCCTQQFSAEYQCRTTQFFLCHCYALNAEAPHTVIKLPKNYKLSKIH
jgi:hypothetical protein